MTEHICLAVLLAFLPKATSGIELTFELPDNANQCFFEDIKSGVNCILEFQVVAGGQYDVDMTLEDPTGKVLYKDVKKQYDNFNWKTETPGTYKACFSNEFSTFSHKIVYMDWQVGDQNNLNKVVTQGTHAMNALESSAVAIADKLRVVDDYQTHHRLREATGRKRAEQLNERVLLWSLGQTALIVLIGIAQVSAFRKISLIVLKCYSTAIVFFRQASEVLMVLFLPSSVSKTRLLIP
ncbi:Emp24/gp25L/p24 family protein [Dictyocaulus viviparus]|uniref:Emp24/gp25L/p24 family protein n=1 Tax=Dictyocaulus viviparus TaxID=29172 RepID=A0A0D8XCW5_DICVI|nr:Emp24/gp25L/p24 family protein [Dictyocaulus viviparus]